MSDYEGGTSTSQQEEHIWKEAAMQIATAEA